MKKYIITIIILFILILLSICGYFVYANMKTNESGSSENINEKALSEIEYLNNEIIDIMNSLNNITYTDFAIENKDIEISEESSENTVSTDENSIDTSSMEIENTIKQNDKEIDWNIINEKIENIYSSWTTVLMDLTTLNVNKDNLLKFNDLTDELIGNIKDEDKTRCLYNCAELYNLLTLYIGDFSNDENIKAIYNTKSNILYAYAIIENDDWNTAGDYISNAKNEFNKIMNDQINNIINIDTINKGYILINELSDDTNKNNKDTFYINYKQLMQELDNIY